MRAIWNDKVIAESDSTVVVEGNHYFPGESIKKEYFEANSSHTNCWWKGRASYYDVKVDGKINRGGAWYYPDPKAKAANIKDHVAFWQGIQVTV